MKLTVAAAILASGFMLASPVAAACVNGTSIASAVEKISPVDQAGCIRWGETGYHWYRWCVGPRWLYPHHRSCHRSGWCDYY